ncbi:MAG: hypothetical protein H7Y30_06410 [Pyrinomonadaceae bacterium]|nr:hypothetical protein [Pyrinomonadaceae bacterium]
MKSLPARPFSKPAADGRAFGESTRVSLDVRAFGNGEFMEDGLRELDNEEPWFSRIIWRKPTDGFNFSYERLITYFAAQERFEFTFKRKFSFQPRSGTLGVSSINKKVALDPCVYPYGL